MNDLDQRNRRDDSEPVKVVVTDIRMPFVSMVIFMVKWTLASIPAIIILVGLLFLLSIIFSAMLAGLVGATVAMSGNKSAPTVAVAPQPTPAPIVLDDPGNFRSVLSSSKPTPTPFRTPPPPSPLPTPETPAASGDKAYFVTSSMLLWSAPPGNADRRSLEVHPPTALQILERGQIEGIEWLHVQIHQNNRSFDAWLTQGSLAIEDKQEMEWEEAVEALP